MLSAICMQALVMALSAADGGGIAQGPGQAPVLQGSWVRVTEHAAFSPRDTSEDLVFDDKMWLSNAYHEGNVLVRDLWCSVNGENWTRVLENTPYDGYSEMVAFKDRMWAVKGSVWSSGDGVEWTQVSAETPFGDRGYGELVIHQDQMWQLGSGQDVWRSEDGQAWTCVASDAAFGRRYASAVAAFQGKLWLMGGCMERPNDPPEKHYPKFSTFNDVWCSEDGAAWTLVTEHASWDPRMWSVAKIYRDRLWIIGGFDNRRGANFQEAWWTQDGVHWSRVEVGWSGRHEPTCYVFQDSLWVVAGNSWPLMNDVWKLTMPVGPVGHVRRVGPVIALPPRAGPTPLDWSS